MIEYGWVKKEIKMTDKEKLINLLNKCSDNSNIEDIFFYYLYVYEKDFSALRIYDIIEKLNSEFLLNEIRQLENAKRISYERALYLNTYLKGDMWETEEAAKKNLQPQINNSQAIMDACK